MPTDSGSSLSLKDSQAQAEKDRETFSHQTLLLTALTAINNENHHPSFNLDDVNRDRVEYMRAKTSHTSIIDAATTILITNTEILATMARHHAHGIFAFKEIQGNNPEQMKLIDDLLTSPDPQLGKIDELLPDHLDMDGNGPVTWTDSDEAQTASEGHVFVSFPNTNKKICVQAPANLSQQSSTSSGPICQPIATDNGHWSQIMESTSGFIFGSKISFGSHVATVREYLNWYRRVDDAKRLGGSSMFAEYIVSACWRKMKRRIGHWASVGLMHNMAKVDLQTLSLLATPANLHHHTSKNSDFKLSLYLRALEKNESLEKILSYHEYHIPSKAILPSEDDSTKTKLILPCLQRLCRDDQNKSLYNEETVVEFHHLLVATMLYYAQALGDLNMEEKARQEADIRVNSAAPVVLRLTRLLNAIVVSGAFQRHIKFLVERNLLQMPSDKHQAVFHKFAVENVIPWAQTRGKLGDGSDSGGKLDSEDTTNDQDSEDATNDQDSEDATNDQDPFFIGTHHWQAISIAIQGWVKLFVQHFHAKRILESFAKNGGREIPIEIKVFGVTKSKKCLPYPDLDTLKTVLKSSLHDQDTELQDETIKVFLSHIQATPPIANNYTATNRIFSVVRDIITKRANHRSRFYDMHCEVALASLVAASKYPDNLKVAHYIDGEVIVELTKLNPKEVAVSKLCCPACWEYFDILSKKHKQEPDSEETMMYQIRGRHSTVFPVQLPSWSCPQVVQELIKRFDKYLRDELNMMWQKKLELENQENQKSRHTHTPSLQSVSSAITHASRNSDESNLDCIADYDVYKHKSR